MKRRKNPAAVSLGRKGGKARAKSLSQAERSEIARLGGVARWKDHESKRKAKE